MYRQLFTYPVFVATALLIAHSWLFRGRRNTLLFWGVGYLIAFGREFVYQNYFHGTYQFTGANLRILNVPVTIPMGWLFEAYTSLYIAQYLMGVDVRSMVGGKTQISAREYGTRVLPVLALSCVLTSTITIAIENVAVRMQWWQVADGGDSVNPGWVIGHMFTVFWLLTLLVYLTHRRLRLQRNLLFVGLTLGFNAVLELGLVGPQVWSHVWGPLVLLVSAGYVAGLFMWRQLLLYVFVSFAVLALIDLNAPQLAPLLGLGGHDVLLALVGTMTALTLYGLYLVRMQGPEHPRLPVELL